MCVVRVSVGIRVTIKIDRMEFIFDISDRVRFDVMVQ